MTEDVKWREATKSDTVYMRSFICTSSRPKRGEIGVEHQVQAFFRQYAIPRVNAAKDQGLDGRLVIAEDSRGIAAAYAHRLLALKEYPKELKIPAGRPLRDLCFLAIAKHHRGKGGAMADEAINEALWDIKDRSPEAPRIYVTGLVDYRNIASMRMLARHRFDELSRGGPPPTGDNRLGRWMRELD